MTERARAERLDADDPLAGFRERFVIEDHETIYLDGNSLGRLPLATRERTNALLDQWGTELVRGWDEWIELPQRVGDLIGAAVLGAQPGETLVSTRPPSTSSSSRARCSPRTRARSSATPATSPRTAMCSTG